MVVPDRKGRVRRLVLSATQLKLSLAGLALGMVILTAILVDYVSLLAQAVENKRLRSESADLRAHFQLVESKLGTLENALERIKTFSTKLKIITAVNDPDRNLNLAIGPLDRPGKAIEELNAPEVSRFPASRIFEEPVLRPRSIVDLASGEIASAGDNDYLRLNIRIDQVTRESSMREQGVLELWDLLADRASLLKSTPSSKPVNGWYTSRFGYRISPYTDKPIMHEGLDIAAAPGTPVYAPADGTVIYAGYHAAYGKLVTIDHGYSVETLYGHNSQIQVVLGQKVRRGDFISSVGSTGRSTGPHLHYEVRVNGVPVDPMNYILDDENKTSVASKGSDGSRAPAYTKE